MWERAVREATGLRRSRARRERVAAISRAVAAAIVVTGDLALRVVVSGASEEYIRENHVPTGGAYV